MGACQYDRAGGERTTDALLSLPRPPTAVFATNHLVAAGVIAAAGRRGVAVPAELSIGSFYDGPVAELLNPSLTAVRFPLEQLGFQAASMLIDLLEGKHVKQTGVVLPHEQVVERDSTAPPHTSQLRP